MMKKLTVWASSSMILGSAFIASGCVRIIAPEKPIEINLNIKIDQEVRLKLEKDVQELIEDNPDIF